MNELESMKQLSEARQAHLEMMKELNKRQEKVNGFLEAFLKLEPPKTHPLTTAAWCDCYQSVSKLIKKHL